MSAPEPWLRGPVAGVPAEWQPAVHALMQAREDLARVVAPLTERQLWLGPGGAASVGFHVVHLAGSLDRLLTYARGEALDDRQRAALAAEQALPGDGPRDAAGVLAFALATIDRAIAQVAATPPASMHDARRVGRAGLPSTVWGLTFHAAEHTQRHVGQAITTARIAVALGQGATPAAR